MKPLKAYMGKADLYGLTVDKFDDSVDIASALKQHKRNHQMCLIFPVDFMTGSRDLSKTVVN